LTAPALHVSALPHGTLLFGMHMPVHLPSVQRYGHWAPFIHWPSGLQVCGVRTLHPVVPGTHDPVHAPLKQALGHRSASIH
jgi:hypothetical protein